MTVLRLSNTLKEMVLTKKEASLSKNDLLLLALFTLPVFALILAMSSDLRMNPNEFGFYFFLHALVIFPLIEEAVFRGFFQDGLNQIEDLSQHFLGEISIANVISSAVFALLYFIVTSSLLAFLVFLPSLLLGLIREKTQSLFWPVLLHLYLSVCFFVLVAF